MDSLGLLKTAASGMEAQRVGVGYKSANGSALNRGFSRRL